MFVLKIPTSPWRVLPPPRELPEPGNSAKLYAQTSRKGDTNAEPRKWNWITPRTSANQQLLFSVAPIIRAGSLAEPSTNQDYTCLNDRLSLIPRQHLHRPPTLGDLIFWRKRQELGSQFASY
jgi:hypothetical protein